MTMEITEKMRQAFYEATEITSVGSVRNLDAGLRAAISAAPVAVKKRAWIIPGPHYEYRLWVGDDAPTKEPWLEITYEEVGHSEGGPAISPAPVSAEPQPQPVDDTIIAWYGTNGAEWRRADGKSASYMIKPVMYVPAVASPPDLAAENERLSGLLHTIEQEKAGLVDMTADRNSWREQASSAAKDISYLAAEIARLREALEWYGEQARLARLVHSEGNEGRRAISEDGGKRARAALADQKGGDCHD